MRLDKYLKNARLIKRRPLAKQAADDGRIKVNGQLAKAGTRVAVGDEIEITFGRTIVTVKVTNLQEIVRKEEASDLYELIKEERIEVE
mgnify:CR=1 FL=1